jgi:hypothetical protein
VLDDMRVLRDAVQDYRAAATSAGLTWPESDAVPGGTPPDLVHRLFDVDHIADQVTWLMSQGWEENLLLPGRGWIAPWPTDVRDALDTVAMAIGAPFAWRRQLPLFRFDHHVFTFVLAGDHEGEIWRYEIDPDGWGPAPAAPGLAALFTQWSRAIRTGMVGRDDHLQWLQVGPDIQGNDDAVARALQQHGLDPLAFPVYLSGHPLLRDRQIESGVDIDEIDRGIEAYEELMDEADIARAQLGG